MIRRTLVALTCALQAGCIVPSEHLSFPLQPLESTASRRSYDVNGDGRPDFAIQADETERFNVLAYDDDEDGQPDRLYRLTDYAPDEVPHLIILLDSIPYQAVAARYATSHWTWFDPPQKVIPPFPTMSPVIFSRMLGAPPLGGMINQYYDRNSSHSVNRLFERTIGQGNAWEKRLHYRLKYWENGLSFLDPRRWYRVELQRAKLAFDACPDRVCIVYLASTAGMLSKFGAQGASEVLDGLEQLCAQVMYERHGAVKISVTSDHGHNLVAGTRIDLAQVLKDAGFVPAKALRGANDCVVELDGLVNYAGIHTRRPADVAAALCVRPEIELAVYLSGDRVIVCDSRGKAAIERRGESYRYVPIDHDVLEYDSIVEQLRSRGKADQDGFAAARDWFQATLDHQWPNAPVRLWDAFHIIAVNVPDVMITARTGYYVGLSSMQMFITMASTHGGLNQVDSATFLLTMTGRAHGALRTEEILKTIEPSYDPAILHR